MSWDFTVEIFKELLGELKRKNYNFVRLEDYFNCKSEKTIILRHDVDRLPGNALRFAEILNNYDIKGTFYFRITKESFDEDIIKKIISSGHEIGYHYEDLKFAKGDYEKAFELFKNNLSELRKYYPVKTICMHGSPLFKWDNKKIWDKYSYKELGIIAEPYLDLDFNKIFYLTDTGRRWNGERVSVRDKVKSNFKESYRTTKEIILAIKEEKFPLQTIFTFHPQRWSDNIIYWLSELVGQKTKNVLKNIIVQKTK